jgi:hypothetical protein
MDRDEKPYFDNLSKLSLDEIRKIFENLKHIGMSDDEIEKYAIDYYNFFKVRSQEEKKVEQSGTIFIGEKE